MVSCRRMNLFGTQSFKVLEATPTILGTWQQEERHGPETLSHVFRHRHGRENQQGVAWAFETSKPLPRDIPYPTRPYPLILPKQFQQLEAKFSSLCAYGNIVIQTTIMSMPVLLVSKNMRQISGVLKLLSYLKQFQDINMELKT